MSWLVLLLGVAWADGELPQLAQQPVEAAGDALVVEPCDCSGCACGFCFSNCYAACEARNPGLAIPVPVVLTPVGSVPAANSAPVAESPVVAAPEAEQASP